jgi:hypothetical protein
LGQVEQVASAVLRAGGVTSAVPGTVGNAFTVGGGYIRQCYHLQIFTAGVDHTNFFILPGGPARIHSIRNKSPTRCSSGDLQSVIRRRRPALVRKLQRWGTHVARRWGRCADTSSPNNEDPNPDCACIQLIMIVNSLAG